MSLNGCVVGTCLEHLYFRMASGKYQASPILLINMAGEMIYILHQRLQTTVPPNPKTSKVINDIVEAIFNEQFVNDLFINSTLLTNLFLRELFKQLAHSSIMKLNDPSFSKLFDLMIMGVKMQVALTSSPLELYPLTLNHLEGIRSLINQQEVRNLIEQTILKFKNKYSHLPFGRYLEMKNQLMNRFKNLNARVTMFLDHGYQSKERGSFHILRRYSPHVSSPIGTAIYSDFKEELYLGQRVFKYNEFGHEDFREWRTDLGMNMYRGVFPLKGFTQLEGLATQKSNQTFNTTDHSVSRNQSYQPAQNKKNQSKASNTQSLDTLIPQSHRAQDIEFTLDLFSHGQHSNPKPNPNPTSITQPIKTFTSDLKQNTLKDLEVDSKEQYEEEDDLTALMDKAMGS